MRRIGVRERRARLGARHLLASSAATVEEAAAALVGLHSSDPATVFLSSWARVDGFEPTDLEDALYVRRSLVRMLGMRRTLFVVPVELAPVMHEACTKALIPGQRTRLIRMLEQQGVAPPGRGETWLAKVEAATLAAIAARGEATARELTADVPELGAKLTFGEGKTWAGTMGVSTRVLFLLATEGLIVRTRPLGTWTSGQYRWATTEHWLGRSARRGRPRRGVLRAPPALAAVVRAGHDDGHPMVDRLDRRAGEGDARRPRGRARSGWATTSATCSPDDLDTVGDVDPWVALLPGLDPTTMGWKERGWYLGDHAAELFDRNGNAGPTVWANGRAVGAWGQTDEGDVVVELFARLDAASRRRLDAERERLAAWLGDVRIRPRFATPLGKELAARSGAPRPGRASRRRGRPYGTMFWLRWNRLPGS